MLNWKLLEEAGLIAKDHEFSKEDRRLLESLSEDEVEALIRIKKKLGENFFRRNTCGAYPPLGIVF